MTVFGCLTAIFLIQYIVIFLAGVFGKRKKYPEQEEKLKYGVIICARNEEKVVANLIESIKKSNYPQELLDIFVIAHNCTDTTAECARNAGAIVYEYNNDEERTKGYALKKVFQLIEQDYKISSYDGYHIFDADNIVDKEYFNKMNDAFLYYNRESAITSFRNSKNFGENVQTACYGILYTVGCSVESNGREAMGCSSRILGSGFLVSNKMVENGWNIVNLSDDTDFTIEQVLKGHKVRYCDEAMYYDEHPTKFGAMYRQRLRWAKGTDIVCRKRFKDLFKTVFCRSKNTAKDEVMCKGSAFDLMCVTLPVGAMGIAILLLDIVLKLFIPLFGLDSTLAWTYWGILFACNFVLGYIGIMITAIVAYAKEKDRIIGVSTGLKVASVLIYPLFALFLAPIQVIAIFSKKQFVWTTIEHQNTSNFDTFNKVETNECATENQIEESKIKEQNVG